MKKLLLLLLLIPAFASAQQTYFSPGVPPGSTPFSPTFRAKSTGTDSLTNIYMAIGNKTFQLYTAPQSWSYFSRLFKGDPKDPLNPLTLSIGDSTATDFNNFAVFKNSNGDLVTPSINYSASTSTVTFNPKINANGGVVLNLPIGAGTSFVKVDGSGNGVRDTSSYLPYYTASGYRVVKGLPLKIYPQISAYNTPFGDPSDSVLTKHGNLISARKIIPNNGIVDSAGFFQLGGSLRHSTVINIGSDTLQLLSNVGINSAAIQMNGKNNITIGASSNAGQNSAFIDVDPTFYRTTWYDTNTSTQDTLQFSDDGILLHYVNNASTGLPVGFDFGGVISGIRVSDYEGRVGLVADAFIDTANMTSTPKAYVTSEWVKGQGYAIAGSGVTTFNTRTGAVTLSGSDVTTALGYTPVTNARTVAGFALSSNVTLANLAAGTGLTFSNYNGSAAITAKADTSVLQTVLNFFPKGDTRYLKSSVISGLANPTATIGFTAVNGSATTGIRSDGAPKADSTVIRSVANSYSLSGMQTKLNNYVKYTDTATFLANYIPLNVNSTIPTIKTFTKGPVINFSGSSVTNTFGAETAMQTIAQDGFDVVNETDVFGTSHHVDETWAGGGTAGSPTATGNNREIRVLAASVYTGAGTKAAEAIAGIQFFTSEVQDATHNGSRIAFLTTKKAVASSTGLTVNAQLNDDGSFGVVGSLGIGETTVQNPASYASRQLLELASNSTNAANPPTYTTLAASGITSGNVGEFDFQSSYNSSGSYGVARMFASLAGSTANNKGGTWTLQTHGDGSGYATAITVDQTQKTTFASHLVMEGVTSTGATGTGNIAFSIAPTFTGMTTLANFGTGSGIGAATNFYTQGGASATSTTNAASLIGGATELFYRTGYYGNTSTQINPNDSYAAVLLARTPVTTGSSGTSAILANLAVKAPLLTVTGGSTVTDAATIYSQGVPAGATGNWNIWAKYGVSRFSAIKADSLLTGTVGTDAIIVSHSGIFGSVSGTAYVQAPNSAINILASTQATLVSGTKAVSVTGTTTGSHAYVTLVTPTGTSLTTQYQAVCTSGTVTIQANVAAGTINSADGSVVNVIVTN